MAKQLFGTDGMRGVAGEYPLDRTTVYAFGLALGHDLAGAHAHPQVLIGADTRESGPWIAATVAAGLQDTGAGVRFAGVITTPGVAYLTRSGPFVAGVMISASHNPYQDNGIKVFSHSGYKLPDGEEHAIEHEILRLTATGVGPREAALEEDPTLDGAYLEYLLGTVPARLDGLRLVADCGNGAASRLAPEAFRRLGAELTVLNAEPNGRNINFECGALHVEKLREAVLARGAECGVAFDGDADRAIFVAASGKIVDGDAVLLACGSAFKRQGRLRGATVVSTVMSNLGLELALRAEGIAMTRTQVGDKYVLEEMIRRDAVLGGEQSGHVIFSEYATTGDGLLTALRLFEIARQAGQGLDELTAGLRIYPQKLTSVRVRERKPLHDVPSVAREIRDCEDSLGSAGRVLVRFSGTEPVARVMVEGPDMERVEHFTTRIADAIRREMGA